MYRKMQNNIQKNSLGRINSFCSKQYKSLKQNIGWKNDENYRMSKIKYVSVSVSFGFMLHILQKITPIRTKQEIINIFVIKIYIPKLPQYIPHINICISCKFYYYQLININFIVKTLSCTKSSILQSNYFCKSTSK